MQLISKKERSITIALSALLGGVIFILIYGYRVLIPTYTDWLLVYGAGDPQQHYFGWRFFQQSQWYFPIGMMDTLGYPIMTSVVFTDSIPLFAVIFKLLTPILPAEFQYFGIWGILCFMLQGALGAVLCLKYARRPVQATLGSLLFILSPAILHRMYYHSALAGHWIILFGLTLLVYHKELSQKPIRAILLWGLLGGLIASIHLYFLPMCGILCIGYCAYDIVKNRRWYGFLPIVSFVAFTLGIGWVLGTFTASTSASSGGLGDYSFNLNGFWNPMWSQYSSVLQVFPSFAEQHEGFAYLGFGVLLLCIVSVCLLLDRYLSKEGERHALRSAASKHRLDLIVYGIMALLFVFIAMSPVVTFNSHVLFHIPIPEVLQELWGIFRSTGRLIWPLGYILIFSAIAIITRHQEKRFAVLLLVCCVGLQAYDLHHRMNNLHNDYSQRVEYENPLTETFWHELGEDSGIEHLVVDNSDGYYRYPLAEIAIQNHWTLNDFYFARHVNGIGDTVGKSLASPDDSMLFVIKPENFDTMLSHAHPSITFYEMDGLIIGTTQKNLISLPELAYSYNYPIGDGTYLRGGEDVDGTRYVYPEGLSYGPYWHLKPGVYEIRITGENLDLAEIVCAIDGADTHIDTYDFRAAADEVSFKIQLFDAVEDLEVLVSPTGAETISFDALTASYVSDNSENLADDPARSFKPLAYRYPFVGNENVNGGEDIDGVRYIQPEGVSYGPYLSVPAGIYRVSIIGTNLASADFDCVVDGGDTSFDLQEVSVTDAKIIYQVEILGEVDSLETRIYNHSDETITLSSLTIESVLDDDKMPI